MAKASKNTAKKAEKWYMTLLGGIIGMLLGLIPSAVCILIFNKLYFVFLIFIPVLVCLFIRIFHGKRGVFTVITAIVLSLIGVYLTGFLIAAGDLVSYYGLPAFEVFRLSFLMLGELNVYGVQVWHDLTHDIFNVIFILSYLAVGMLFSWEFILRSAEAKGGKSDTQPPKDSGESDDDEYEYEYVYEDELEPDDIVEEE
jgi:hypothetical protein